MTKAGFELYQLRCFVAVAEELNFRRAAMRLNMTQPPLSRQIRMLEHAVEETLFERSTREVRLTPAGANFLSSANEILQRSEQAVLMARQAARGEAGDVALGFVPSAGIEFVPLIVRSMQDRLPQVTFKPSEMMSYEIIQALLSGQLDLGLTRMARRYPAIESVKVVSERFVLAVPADHPLAHVPSPRLSDLRDAPFVGYSAERGGFLREQHAAVFAGEGFEPDTVMEVSQTISVLALVNQGIGLALVPESAQAVQMANLAYRQIETPGHFRSTLYLTIGPKNRDTRLFTRIRRIISEALAGFR